MKLIKHGYRAYKYSLMVCDVIFVQGRRWLFVSTRNKWNPLHAFHFLLQEYKLISRFVIRYMR